MLPSVRQCSPHSDVGIARLYSAPPSTSLLHPLAYHSHIARKHVLIFAAAVCLAAPELPGWLLPVALLCAVGARAALVLWGFEAETEGCGRVEGTGGEWHEDARCVWRVLCGEGEREILRVCAGGRAVNEE